MQTVVAITIAVPVMALADARLPGRLGGGYQSVLICGCWLFWILSDKFAGTSHVLLILTSCACAGTVIAIQTRQKIRQDRALREMKLHDDGMCVACGYDVRQGHEFCPECGVRMLHYLVLHNDEIHTAQQVVDILANVTGMPPAAAGNFAAYAHANGQVRIVRMERAKAEKWEQDLRAKGLTITRTTRRDMGHCESSANTKDSPSIS